MLSPLLQVILYFWNRDYIFPLEYIRNKKSLKRPNFGPKGLSEAINRTGLTMQWPKEKGQRDKQRSTKQYTENSRSRNTSAPEGYLVSPKK